MKRTAILMCCALLVSGCVTPSVQPDPDLIRFENIDRLAGSDDLCDVPNRKANIYYQRENGKCVAKIGKDL